MISSARGSKTNQSIKAQTIDLNRVTNVSRALQASRKSPEDMLGGTRGNQYHGANSARANQLDHHFDNNENKNGDNKLKTLRVKTSMTKGYSASGLKPAITPSNLPMKSMIKDLRPPKHGKPTNSFKE